MGGRVEAKRWSLRWGGALLGLAVMFSQSAVAASDGVQATILSYEADAALTYIDAYQNPAFTRLPSAITALPTAAAANSADATPATSGPAQPRTLGLRRMKLGLAWQAAGNASLRLALRPDAVNRQYEAGALQTVPREFDDRSGDPGMRPMPTIRLLDAYQLLLSPSPELNIGAGVWENLGEAQRAYPELLGFGLTVLFPAKFAGVRLNWQLPNRQPDTAAAAGPGALPSPFEMSLFLFQGDEDRAEALSETHGSFDTAPTARDAYHGGAGVFSWRVLPSLTLGVLAGYSNEADPQGSYDQVFGQFSAVSTFVVAGHAGKVSLDSRYLRSHGRDGVADQTLMSASLTSSVAINERIWGLIGLSDGKGDRWLSYTSQRSTTAALQGYHVEGGVLNRLGQNLYLQLMMSHEYRTMRVGTTSSGGFQDAVGSQPTIHRVGLELTYRLDQNA